MAKVNEGSPMEVRKVEPGSKKSNPTMKDRGSCELTGGIKAKKKAWLLG